MMNKKLLSAGVLSLFFLSGCAKLYLVKTEGFLDKAKVIYEFTPKTTFAVLENKKAEDVLLDKKIKSRIEKWLVNKGYSLTGTDKAQYCLTFDYGVNAVVTTSNAMPAYPAGGSVSSPFGPATVQTPNYVASLQSSDVLYTKTLKLKVIDAESYRNDGSEALIWSGNTISQDRSSDINEAIEYLIVSAFRYFGQNTDKKIEVMLEEDDKEVQELRGY